MADTNTLTRGTPCQLDQTAVYKRCELMRRILRKILPEASVSLFVCLLALFPLLDPGRNFGLDWFNHLWTVEYTGQHLLQRQSVPDVLNTPEMIGAPNLLFYASKFYAVLGTASIWLGSALAFRLFALLFLLLQFWHVRRAAGLFCPSPWICCMPAVAVTWGIYPLVDLYERNDLTEFAAATFLVSAIATLFVFLVRTARGERDAYGWTATGLLYGFAAITNPLTGMYGGIFLGILGLVGLIMLRRRTVFRFGLLSILLLGALLSPWLYVVLKFGHLVQISNAGVNAGLFQISYVSTPLGSLISTMNPAYTGSAFVHLADDARALQIPLCLPLLFYASALIVFWRIIPRRTDPSRTLLSVMLGISYLAFGLCLLVYCSPGCSGLIDHAFDIMQYPYRLLDYIDASLLVSTLCLLGLVDWNALEARTRFRPISIAVVLTAYLLAAGVLAAKLCFVQSPEYIATLEDKVEQRFSEEAGKRVSHWYPRSFGVDKALVAHLPKTWYAEGAYAVDTGYSTTIRGSTRLEAIKGPFAVNPGDNTVPPMEIYVRDATELTTNVAPFPWNVISLDGHAVDSSNLIVVADALKMPGIKPEILRVHVPPGRHILTYAFVPDEPWPFLKDLSWVILLAWMGLWWTVIIQRAVYWIQH